MTNKKNANNDKPASDAQIERWLKAALYRPDTSEKRQIEKGIKDDRLTRPAFEDNITYTSDGYRAHWVTGQYLGASESMYRSSPFADFCKVTSVSKITVNAEAMREALRPIEATTQTRPANSTQATKDQFISIARCNGQISMIGYGQAESCGYKCYTPVEWHTDEYNQMLDYVASTVGPFEGDDYTHSGFDLEFAFNARFLMQAIGPMQGTITI